MKDRQGKGRYISKLSQQDIIKILEDTRTYAQISLEYNITASHICNIKYGKVLKQLTKEALSLGKENSLSVNSDRC
jgi:hypothetical protein